MFYKKKKRQEKESVLALVDEKSLTHTTKFVHTLEKKMGFKIDCVQTDNGSEFTSTQPHSVKKTAFQQVLESFGIRHIHTRPYSPW